MSKEGQKPKGMTLEQKKELSDKLSANIKAYDMDAKKIIANHEELDKMFAEGRENRDIRKVIGMEGRFY
jgi:Cu/Ag efflux protein CusF